MFNEEIHDHKYQKRLSVPLVPALKGNKGLEKFTLNESSYNEITENSNDLL